MRKRWRRLAAGLGACAALSGGWLPGAARAATPPTTYRIGIDNVNQPGHNWEYIDFFPRDNINVTSGDVLHFSWNPAPDAFHTATLLPTGQTPAQAWQATPLTVPDSDDPGNKQMLNPALGPTNPPPGSGAPGACGDAAAPCTFDGSKLLNSGPNSPPSDFFVKVTAGAGSYDVVCLIHPGMHMTFNVVSTGASTQAGLDSAAASQYQADTAEGNAAENAVTASTATNPDGTHTITAHAGTAGPHELIDEMLPAHLDVHPGDKVTWVASPNNIHTVSFPAGPGSASVDPFGAECQSASGPDTPPTSPNPPDFGCPGGPPSAEQLFNPAPMGPNVIRNGGYRLGAKDGGVFDFGNSPYLGSASQFHPKSPVVNLTNTADGHGYWQVGADGGVFTFGDAPFFGSAAGKATSPVIGMFAAPDDSAYVLVDSAGKGYPFGPLPPGIPNPIPPPAPKLAAPVVGTATSSALQGPGYWEVAADGGVFNIAAAPFFGSAGNIHLAKPIVGMAPTPDGGGYYLVASDGGIFTYGDAAFHGSLGAIKLNAPIVGMAVTDSGNGYFLFAADGGVFTFGDARFAGSTGSLHLVSPVNSGSTVPGTIASSGVITQPPLPFPNSYTYSFPEGGTFAYQCLIHDHMRASVSVG